MRSKLTSPTLTSNSRQNSYTYIGYFFIWPIPAETCYKSFLTSDMTLKNDVLTSILTFFHQKFCHVATLPLSLLPTGFNANTDHPSAGEVPLGRGPHCGAAPVKLQSVSGLGLHRVRGVLSWAGLSLFLSLGVNVAAPFCADSRNRSALYIRAKYRERWVNTSWKRGKNRVKPR